MGTSEQDKHGTHDQHNVHGDPEGNVEADTASGGAPEPAGTDEGDPSEIPPENPSGG